MSYVCDWVNDDQPYMIDAGDKKLVSLPYSMEINDRPAHVRRDLVALIAAVANTAIAAIQ